MKKAATVQSRMNPELKQDAELILNTLGLTASQAINAFYAQIVLVRGIPFDIKMPNKETQEAMQELDSGKGERFSSMSDLLKDAEIDEPQETIRASPNY